MCTTAFDDQFKTSEYGDIAVSGKPVFAYRAELFVNGVPTVATVNLDIADDFDTAEKAILAGYKKNDNVVLSKIECSDESRTSAVRIVAVFKPAAKQTVANHVLEMANSKSHAYMDVIGSNGGNLRFASQERLMYQFPDGSLLVADVKTNRMVAI